MSPPTDSLTHICARVLKDVPHGFLGRTGGASVGIHASLNVGLGSADDPESILQNRRIAAGAVLPGAALTTAFQVHSTDVIHVTSPFSEGARPNGDALVTDRPGVLLGILTADCGPVLFADHHAGVVGAAHAGWKGALAGVTDATITAMERLGADRGRITAAVGPCIARASYEVDDDFARRFEEQALENERFFTPGRAHHHQFDLEGYIVHRLARAGLTRIEALGLDTYADPARFFSFRRATHRHEPDYGRQISLIGLAS